MIAPLKESLEKVTSGLQELERGRSAASGALSAQIRDLVEAQARLQGETASLASAMRASGTRGRWGEMQLRRVVELAGMVSYCDFVEQATFSAGRRDAAARPRRAPAGRAATWSSTPRRRSTPTSRHRSEPTRRRSAHSSRLHARTAPRPRDETQRKGVLGPFEPTPGFVVLFIPGEPLFAAALEQDPALIEDAAKQRRPAHQPRAR